jgi:YggT family protein
MFAETLQFLIRTLSNLFVLVLLLRFYLQVAHAPFRHPLCQFVMAVTNFLVLRLRRIVPSYKSYDMATLMGGWLVGLLANAIILALNPVPYNFAASQTWLALALISVLYLFQQSLYLLMGAVIVQAVMSWINPYNPLAPILDSLTRPYLRPFRRAAVGGIDLSPVILFLIIQVILMLPVRWLESTLLTQLKILM